MRNVAYVLVNFRPWYNRNCYVIYSLRKSWPFVIQIRRLPRFVYAVPLPMR